MSDHQVMESEGARPSNWIWAVAAGVVAAVVATWLTGMPVATALLFGAVVFVIYAVVLAQFWEEPASGDHDHGHGHDDHGHDDHGHGESAHHDATHAAQSVPAARLADLPVTPIAPVAPLAFAPPPVASEPVAPQPAASPVAAAEPAPVAADAPLKPLGLSGPRGGKADNLQEIEGIGPGLEKLANELGIFHFDQIAGWGASEIAWMDGNLKGFKGRVTRDKWVAQARIIATEGVEAFRIRAKTNDY